MGVLSAFAVSVEDAPKVPKKELNVGGITKRKLVEKLRFDNPERERHYTATLKPGVSFLKLLISQVPPGHDGGVEFPTCKLWMPDTVILCNHYKAWIYTNGNGSLVWTDDFRSEIHIAKRFNVASSKDFAAVLKKNGRTANGNDHSLVRPDRVENAADQARTDPSPSIIQRFVRPRGKNAGIYRCIWKRDKPFLCYIITNKTDTDEEVLEWTSADHPGRAKAESTWVVQCHDADAVNVDAVNPRGISDAEDMVNNIVHFASLHLSISLEDIVVDFVRDVAGNMWFEQQII